MPEDFLSLIEVYPLFGYIFLFVMSATVGSFLNVVIYRYPLMIQYEYAEIIRDNSDSFSKDVSDILVKGKGLSLSLPSSHCFSCSEKISWYHNIPIFSYIFLGGKCFNCKEKYSSRYFYIELFHTISWLSLFYYYGVSIEFVVFSIVFSLILTMSMIDFDHKILPDGLVFSLYGLGLLYSTTSNSLINPDEAIFNSIIGFLICHSFISIYSKIRGKLMMGFGDIKLITATLAFIPVISVVMGVLIASGLGIFYYLVIKGLNKLDSDKSIPFGPFICFGFFIQIILFNQRLF